MKNTGAKGQPPIAVASFTDVVPDKLKLGATQAASPAHQPLAQGVRPHLRRQCSQVERRTLVPAGIVAADRLGLGDAGRRKFCHRRGEIILLDAISQTVKCLLPAADQRIAGIAANRGGHARQSFKVASLFDPVKQNYGPASPWS